MPKFTIFFKDKPIQSSLFETGIIHIGSDDTNELKVDSLALAPVHAVAVIGEKGSLIKQLNENFPLIVNNVKIKEHPLINGDKITIGKHTIVFNTTEIVNAVQHNEISAKNHIDSQQKPELNKTPDASLQILGGKHIGRVIPLKKSMTRLGRSGDGIVVITKRKEGFFISALENDISLTVNHQPIGDSTLKLNQNDLVTIDNNPMQFFIV